MPPAWDFCRIRAPARLHLGFVDMHGGLGRRFGSVGIALGKPCLDLSARPASVLEVVGEGRDSVDAAAKRFLRSRQDAGETLRAARIQVHAAIPRHCGFGSGTQIALAAAHIFARLNGLELSNREVMRTMGRGRRSGVGVSVFECGGLVVDGGKGDSDFPPPQLVRLSLPDPWRVVLISDASAVGLQGVVETGAFDRLPRFSASCAAYLARVVLMELLPGVAEADFSSFAMATMRLQDAIGDYFLLAQGGRYASSRVGSAIEHFRERGVKGIGQSSWGPTGFVFAPDEERAQDLVAMGKRAFPEDTGLGFSITGFDNEGASMTTEPADG